LEGLATEDVSIFTAILSILRPNGIVMAIWYILWLFGTVFPRFGKFLVSTEKNLATLHLRENPPVRNLIAR
jgi:hypothetical protein